MIKQSKQNNSGSDNRSNKSNKQNYMAIGWQAFKRRWNNLEDGNKIQSCIALMSVISVVCFIVSLYYTRETIKYVHNSDLANDSMRQKELRAYMDIDTIRLVNLDTINGIKIRIVIVNNGKTPAYKLNAKFCNIISISEVTQEAINSALNLNIGHNHPDCTSGQHRIYDYETINFPEMISWISRFYHDGNVSIYFAGKVTYYDAFGKKDSLQFCKILDRRTFLFYSYEKYNYSN